MTIKLYLTLASERLAGTHTHPWGEEAESPTWEEAESPTRGEAERVQPEEHPKTRTWRGVESSKPEDQWKKLILSTYLSVLGPCCKNNFTSHITFFINSTGALILLCRFLPFCNLEDMHWCEIQLICFEVLGLIRSQSSLGSSCSRYILKLLLIT